MLNKIEKILGKKVRWATIEEIEGLKKVSESMSYKNDDEIFVDTIEEEGIYYISKDFSFQGYVVEV